VVHRLARPAPARVARRQLAASAAASASCATALRRGRLLRKSRHAAANDQESKVRAREIRASGMGASVGQRSVVLPPRHLSVLQRQSAVRLSALRPRDRAVLPPRGHDHNRPRQREQRPAEVAHHREAAVAGGKSSGSRPAYASSRRSLQCSTAGGCIAPAEPASAEAGVIAAFAHLRSAALRTLQWRAPL
jgi:hypothetical protein